MLVKNSSLIAVQSYASQQALERIGSGAERISSKPGNLSKTAERGLREPFVLVDLTDEATQKLSDEKKASTPKPEPNAKPVIAEADLAENKFLREAPKANAQPVITRPGTNLDISV